MKERLQRWWRALHREPHTWTKWEAFTRQEVVFFGGPQLIRFQERHCVRCGLREETTVRSSKYGAPISCTAAVEAES